MIVLETVQALILDNASNILDLKELTMSHLPLSATDNISITNHSSLLRF